MSIDKSLYAAPLGIDEMEEMADIEIEIENPEGVRIGMDGLEIEIEPGTEGDEEEFDSNLAEFMDEGELQKIAEDIMGDVESDINSRKEWVEMYVKGLDVLGMKYKERSLGSALVACSPPYSQRRRSGFKVRRLLRRSLLKALSKRKSLEPLISLKNRRRSVSEKT